MSLNATATPGYGFAPAGSTAGAGARDASDPHAFLYPHHAPDVARALIATAQALVSPRGVGIYATDETPDGIGARLAAADKEAQIHTEWSDEQKRDRRRRWRECLYETLPTEYISGVILHYETLVDFQLAPLLTARGIIPGVRADTDSHPLPISPGEPATQGLDDLLPRLQTAYAAGARFTKWRAPLLLTASSLPSHAALEAQAEALARFAAVSQQAGLVPIVEPDVDFGGDASLARSVEIHARALALIYARCAAYGVLLEGTLLKPSFPQPGTGHPARATTAPADVAQATLAVLARAVPAGVAGVVFLSGGLPDATAAAYLQAANALLSASQDGKPGGKREYARVPPLTFSFGRGLQGDAMVKWAAGDEAGARAVFRARAEELSRAAKGEPL